MAHLWVTAPDGAWTVHPLEAEHEVLAGRVRDRMPHERSDPDAETVVVLRVHGTDRDCWLLMAGAAAVVSVNGEPAPGGLRVLCDRDEIYVQGERCFLGERCYFSTETLARVVPFTGHESTAVCPRCEQAIAPAAEAVRCPLCGIWHHQSASLPCWTYADTCSVCPQPTDLEAGYRWTPEDGR